MQKGQVVLGAGWSDLLDNTGLGIPGGPPATRREPLAPWALPSRCLNLSPGPCQFLVSLPSPPASASPEPLWTAQTQDPGPHSPDHVSGIDIQTLE